MIDKATIQRVTDAADIVEVVSEFVTLKRSGVNYKGLCPFHNEKTPSFTVSPSRQMCKCFSCGKGGNAVHFLMELEHMTYPEAIKWLGKKYGIEVREKELTDEERLQQNERESMFALNEWACKYFQDMLHNDVDGVAQGMAYFRQRGFRDDIIRKFALGYSSERRDAMSKAALAHGFNEKYLIDTGLCYRREGDGSIVDRYHGRVIFPVHSVSGRVVAFGGRVLNTEKNQNVGKYVNSTESVIYSKSNELYGLYQAKNAIVRHDCCYLVEGYTDVISMHQSGVENVVASSGTSLTEGQVKLLHRFTDNITILYDGDAAGIKASKRGIDMLLAEGLNIKVLLLPDGDDPDSFARKHRADDFKAYIEQHQVDFIKFKTGLLIKEAQNDPIKRAEMITGIVKDISVIPNNIVRQMYIHECASHLSISEELIVSQINKEQRAQRMKESKRGADDGAAEAAEQAETAILLPADKELASERLLATLVILYGERKLHAAGQADGDEEQGDEMRVAEYISQSLLDDGLTLRNALYARILQEAVENCREEGWKSLSYFLSQPDADVSQAASDLGQEQFVLSTNQRAQYTDDAERLDDIVPHVLHDYKHAILKEQLKSILQELRNPVLKHDAARQEALMRQYMELSEMERQFAKVLGDRVVLN